MDYSQMTIIRTIKEFYQIEADYISPYAVHYFLKLLKK